MKKIDALIAYHGKQCAKIGYGKCSTLRCMKRGGHKNGTPADYSIATCEEYETVEILRSTKALLAVLTGGSI